MFCLYLIIYVMAFIPPDIIIITVEFRWVFSILYVRFFLFFQVCKNHFCKSLVVEINIIIWTPFAFLIPWRFTSTWLKNQETDFFFILAHGGFFFRKSKKHKVTFSA